MQHRMTFHTSLRVAEVPAEIRRSSTYRTPCLPPCQYSVQLGRKVQVQGVVAAARLPPLFCVVDGTLVPTWGLSNRVLQYTLRRCGAHGS
jgi:hypothetical protein